MGRRLEKGVYPFTLFKIYHNNMARSLKRNNKGFTILEMAIVMAIMGLLAGALVPLAKSVYESRKASDIDRQLKQAKEVLLANYMAKGYLPCPDMTGALDTVGDGTEDCSVGGGTILAGKLPYADLSFPPNDSTGRPIRYVVLRQFTEHSSVTNNLRRTRCEILKNLPSTAILVNDTGNMVRVPFLVFSGGPEDRDGIGGLADGDNRDGDSAYEKKPSDDNFDDILEYGSAFEMYRNCCGSIVVVNVNSGSISEKYNQTLRVDQSFDGGSSWITGIGNAPDGGSSGELDIEVGSMIRIYDPQSGQYIANFVFGGGEKTFVFD